MRCVEEARELGAVCHYRHQLLEKLSQMVVKQFLEMTIIEEALMKNCQGNHQLNTMRKFFRVWRRNVPIVVNNRVQIENIPVG